MMAAGDHLKVKRRRWFVSYYHHGIDVGNSRVIHFSGPRKEPLTVVESSLEEFLRGGVKEIVDYSPLIDHLMKDPHQHSNSERASSSQIRERIDDAEAAVAEARKHLGKKGNGPYPDESYDLRFHESEDFAVYCKTGFVATDMRWILTPLR